MRCEYILSMLITMFVSIDVRLQFVIGIGAEKFANAQQQLKRSGFLVDVFDAIKKLLEISLNISAN